MKTSALALLVACTACAGQRYAERTPLAPPAAPAPPSVAPKTIAPADEAATREWLDQEIELAPVIQPPEPMVQIVERVVERPVYARRYDYDYDYNYGYRYPHSDPYYRPRYRHYSTFPINTALGAGIGAIIGHQSGRRGRGAWIGGGLGYLFDVGRYW